MMDYEKKLIEVIQNCNLIAPEQLELAMKKVADDKKGLGEVLCGEQLLNPDQFLWVKSQACEVPLVRVDPEAIDVELVRSFPSELLWEGKAIPLLQFDQELSVAFADPTRLDVVQELERLSGCIVMPSIANPDHIHAALEAIVGRGTANDNQLESIQIDPTVFGTDDDSGVALIFYNMMQAVQKGADELSFRSTKAGVKIFYRIDGNLVLAETASVKKAGATISRLLIMARLDQTKGGPIAGNTMSLELFQKRYKLEFISFQSKTDRSVKIKIRPEAPEKKEHSIEFSEEDRRNLEPVIAAKTGLLLVNSTNPAFACATVKKLLELSNADREVAYFGEESLCPVADAALLGPTPESAQKLLDLLEMVDPDIAVVDLQNPGEIRIPYKWILSPRLFIALLPFHDALSGLLHCSAGGVDGVALAASFAGSLAMAEFPLMDVSNREPTELPPVLGELFNELELDFFGKEFYRSGNPLKSAGNKLFYEIIYPDRDLLALLIKGAGPNALHDHLRQWKGKSILGQAARSALEGSLSIHEILRF